MEPFTLRCRPSGRRRRRETRRAALLVAIAILALAPPGQAQGTDPIERAAASRARGREDAPVLVYEIADFQCPFCARFSREVFPRLDSAYVQEGDVQWVFVNLPLPNHPRAWAAAEAALCAGAVADAFWTLHDRLFNGRDEWSEAPDPLEVFMRYAEEAGIPIEPFRECIVTDLVAPLLLKDIIFAASSRLSGTPTFVIDQERVIVGHRSYEEWQEILGEALRKKAKRP